MINITPETLFDHLIRYLYVYILSINYYSPSADIVLTLSIPPFFTEGMVIYT